MNNEIIRIEDVELERVTYKDQPVLTMPDIDKVHGRPEGTAKRTFNQHREKFLLGVDFHELPYEEWSVLVGRNTSDQGGETYDQKTAGGHRGSMAFFTLRGYLMLVKTFSDDRAWRVQGLLVDAYFNLKAIQSLSARNVENERLKDELIDTQRRFIAVLEKKVVRKRLSDADRKAVFDLYKDGLTCGEIAARVGRHKSVVSNLIQYGVSSGRIVKV